VLPAAIERIRRKLASTMTVTADGHILNAVLTDGLPRWKRLCER